MRTILERHRARIRNGIAEHERALHDVPTADEWCCSTGKAEPMDSEAKRNRRCSFCGNTREEVRRMIAGPNDVVICNECVALCNDLIAEHGAGQEAEAGV